MGPILSLVHIVEFGYAQLAPSVGISYEVVVLLRHARGKCLEVNQGVMLKVVLGGLLGDPLGGKEDRIGTKIGSISRRKGSSALEKGHFKHTGQCQVLQGTIVLIEGMRNLNICIG